MATTRIFATLLPNIGLLGVISFTALWWDIAELYQSPPWALHNRLEIYIPLVVGGNLCLGFSSYLVSRSGFLSAIIPLVFYAGQLALSWAHFPILYVGNSPRWGFVVMAMATITASVTTILFWGVDQIAGALTIPNLLYFAYNTYYDWWVYWTTTRLKGSTKSNDAKKSGDNNDVAKDENKELQPK
uniref:Translocator protein n=1 Tax=Lygus hesperus TaxID=30085 RepID=A0A0A9XG47_LYGHE